LKYFPTLFVNVEDYRISDRLKTRSY